MKSERHKSDSRLLAEIDELTSEVQHATMAVKVERLLESAAPSLSGLNCWQEFRDFTSELQQQDPSWRWFSGYDQHLGCDPLEDCEGDPTSELWTQEPDPDSFALSHIAALAEATVWNDEAEKYQLDMGIHLPVRRTWTDAGNCGCYDQRCPWRSGQYGNGYTVITTIEPIDVVIEPF